MNAWCTGLYIDSFPRDFSAPNPYRGQNANMHMCEAQIALFEALGTPMHLERATAIAHKLCVALPVSAAAPFASSQALKEAAAQTAAGCYGRVCEHYTSDWVPDPEKNKDADPASEEYIFRPFGFQPGHSFEWCKLILMIEGLQSKSGASEEARAWMLPAAELIFETACECGWDGEKGGPYCKGSRSLFRLLSEASKEAAQTRSTRRGRCSTRTSTTGRWRR